MDEATQERLKILEERIQWLLSIPNEYNRSRLFGDKKIVSMIDEKLRIMESEYD